MVMTEEWNKERVRDFLKSKEGVVEITTHVRFKEYTEKGYQKKIPDEIFCRTMITTEMFNDVKNQEDLFLLQVKEMGIKIFNLIKKVFE